MSAEVFLLKAVSKRVQTRACSQYVERERVRRSQRQVFLFEVCNNDSYVVRDVTWA